MKNRIHLSEIRKAIPPECFKKSLPRSLYYMFRDLALLSTAFYTFPLISDSPIGLFLYWNVYGFLMWCLFVVGHDCGHGSFSKYPLINGICGHICHTPLFVPFYPWAYSHKKHHQYHNHVQKDTSHPWFTEEEMRSSIGKRVLASAAAPFVGFGFYLFPGFYDGSHINPKGKLFKNAPSKEPIKCAISTLSLLAFAGLLYWIFPSWTQMLLGYGGCWIIFCFWLFMVTYMQHHEEGVTVYDDSSWDFVSGALETVDRSFNFGIDDFHHNITDCHLVHHLLFTQIPHYHLKKATEAIIPLVKDKYKYKKHRFFLWDFWKLFFSVNFTKWILKSSETSPSQEE